MTVSQDILWHAFKMKVSAKMIQRSTFSSPHSGIYQQCLPSHIFFELFNNFLLLNWYFIVQILPLAGKALAIFKSKEAAEFVISDLKTRCLVLGDGRYLSYLTSFYFLGLVVNFPAHNWFKRYHSIYFFCFCKPYETH